MQSEKPPPPPLQDQNERYSEGGFLPAEPFILEGDEGEKEEEVARTGRLPLAAAFEEEGVGPSARKMLDSRISMASTARVLG